MNKLRCDILILGTGAAGGVLAATLSEDSDLDIVVLERGGHFKADFFNQRELDMSVLYAERGSRTTSDGAMPVRGGECVGGGTTVNLALCFDPVRTVWDDWRKTAGLQGFSFEAGESDYGITDLNLARCLGEVRERLNVHEVPADLVNDNNRLLEDGCQRLGISSKRFELNMRDCLECGFCAQGCAYDRKQGTLVTYIEDALRNGVRLLHHCDVEQIRFENRHGKQTAVGVSARVRETAPGSQSNLVAPGALEIDAKLVIVACGAVETPCLLQRSGHPDPDSLIGRGMVLHPSLPVIGMFDRKITNCEGISGSVYSDHYYTSHGFYLECLFGHPAYGAAVVPGFGAPHYEVMRQYNQLAGFGVMLVDSVRPENRVRFDGRPKIDYRLAETDKERLRFAARRAVEVMLAAGAETVLLPTDEPLGPLEEARFRTRKDAVHCRHLRFVPHQTTLTSAHVQATVKMGEEKRGAVINSRGESHRVQNLIVCDSSAFPTSCGANPMISIMAMARYQGHRIRAEYERYSAG